MPTLTQSNFVARVHSKQHLTDTITTSDTDTEADPTNPTSTTLDPGFLAALPPDLRQELLDQHRQARLQRTGGIDLSMHAPRGRAPRRKATAAGAQEEGPLLDRVVMLPAPTPRPAFTAKKLTALEDLRGAVGRWVRAFRDEPPYDEDAAALARYLVEVVRDERDVGKAVAVVKWLAWVLGEVEEVADEVMGAWRGVLGRLERDVQDAATARGFGRLVFG